MSGYLTFIGNIQFLGILTIKLSEQIGYLVEYPNSYVHYVIIYAFGLFANILVFFLKGIKIRFYIIGVFIIMMLFFIIKMIFVWTFAYNYSSSSMVFGQDVLPDESSLNIINTYKLWIFAFVGHSVCVNISEETV